MPIGWFIAPYERMLDEERPIRRVVVDQQTAQIVADGGAWTETEVVGQAAIVKVRASAATLQAINDIPGVTRIPVARLDDSLATLSAAQKLAIRTWLLAPGRFTLAELQARFPDDLGNYTLRDLLLFIVGKPRRKVRFDQLSNQIVDDGEDQPVRSIDSVDVTVT